MRVIVVGGGVSGLFIAYNLALRYDAKVTILEEKYVGAGGTFRCATGVRASFSSREHVALMKRAISLWRELGRKLADYGFKFLQHGYLWLARREEGLEALRRLSKFHNSLGVPTRLVDSSRAAELTSGLLNVDVIVGGLHDPTAGKAPVFDLVWALLRVLREAGVEIRTGVSATKLVASKNTVEAVETTSGRMRADYYVVAAGSKSASLLATIGVELPLRNEPKHVLITEKFAYTLKPLVIDWDTSGAPYIVQTVDGGFYMSRDLGDKPGLPLTAVRIDAFERIVKPLAQLFPFIRNVNILRYWMGYYVTTPDHHPILGPVPGYENLYLATGFSGHGYMMGPVTGEVVADWIARGRPALPEAERLTLERFRRGELIEETVVIG